MRARLGAALFVVIVSVLSLAVPAYADPDGNTLGSLREQLEVAARGYLDANTALEQSKVRQGELTVQLEQAEEVLRVQSVDATQIAVAAFKLGGFRDVVGVLDSGSPEALLDRMTLLNAVASREASVLGEARATRDQVLSTRAAIDAEIVEQQAQVEAMGARKREAEQALWAHGGGSMAGGYTSNSVIGAMPAPRNADGSLPGESCSLDDPTTSGCISPRTLHAMQQAQAAGFTHYVSCYRDGGSGEHPKGKACDFSSNVRTFVDADAQGDDRTYGNSLAAFFVNNAHSLGVLYVIWYRQIWLPGSGWVTYSGCCDAASMHTNHVHLSMY